MRGRPLHIARDVPGLPAGGPASFPPHLPEPTPSRIVAGEREAITQAWRLVGPGDRLIVVADEVEETLAQVQELAARLDRDTACDGSMELRTAARGREGQPSRS